MKENRRAKRRNTLGYRDDHCDLSKTFFIHPITCCFPLKTGIILVKIILKNRKLLSVEGNYQLSAKRSSEINA